MAKASYEKIWMIDFFLRNLVDYQILSTNPDSQPDLMLDIVENEVYVIYAVQASITTKCPMDFSSYPFDSQTCRLEILCAVHVISTGRRMTNLLLNVCFYCFSQHENQI